MSAGNTLGTATVLNLTTSGLTLPPDTVTPSETDYYRFAISSRSSFNLSLVGLDGNANVSLLDRQGNPLSLNSVPQRSANTSNFAESINTVLDVGTYYIQVSAGAGTTSATYTLNAAIANNLQPGILWRNSVSGQNALWTLNGATIAAVDFLPTVADPNWSIQATADFNSDGQTDIVWRNAVTGQNAIWTINGIEVLSGYFLTTVSDLNWQIQGAGDFNGDGNTDILWRNYATGQNAFWLLNGATIIDAPFFSTVADVNWRIQGTGDFDGDGNLDLLWRNYSTGETAFWLLNGTQFASGQSFSTVTDLAWQFQGTGDFNQDGQTDIFWRNYRTGENAIWLMNRLTFSEGFFIPSVADVTWRAIAPFTRPGSVASIDIAGNTLPTALNLGTNLFGTATYQDAAGGLDTNDYYQFNLGVRSNVNLLLNGLTGNLDLQLLDSTGAVLRTVAQAGSAAESLTDVLAAGTYYVRVFPADSSAISRYALNFTINNFPTLTINTSLTLDEGSEGLITNAFLRADDPDNTSAQLTYTITSLPTVGSLLLNGTPLAIGSTFTQADLDDGTRLRYQNDGSEAVSDSFGFSVSDGAGGVLTGNIFNITINPVNDQPVLTVPGAQSADQGANSTIAGISITDPDAGNGNITVTLSALNGLLSLGSLAGLTFAPGQGTGTQDASMTFSGTLSAVNNALTALIYRGDRLGTDTITLNVSDNGNTGAGGALSDRQTIAVTVAPVNQAPSITLPTITPVADEDISFTLSGLSVGDVDAGGSDVTVSLSVVNGVLSLGSTAGLQLVTGTGSEDRNVTFSGSLALVNAALNNLAYLGDRDFNGTDTLTISVNDNGNTGNGVPLSETRTLELTVRPVNDAPTLTVPPAQTVNENADLRLTGIVASDVDANSGNLTVSLSATRGTLSLLSVANLVFTSGNGTQNTSMIFSGTLSAINNALNTLIYRGNPNVNGADTIDVSITDNGNTGAGIARSDSKAIAIDILGVNQPPVITLPSVPAATAGVNLPISGIGITDPDGGNGSQTVTLAVANGVLSLTTGTGLTFLQGAVGSPASRLTFRGTLAAINTALASLVYRSNPNFTNAFDTITISANDEGNTGIGTPRSDTKRLLVNVGGASNSAPVATPDLFTLNEDAPFNGNVLTNDTDVEDIRPGTAQLLTQPSQALNFTLNPNGSFSYTPALNYNGSDSFTYITRDSLGAASNTATVNLTINSVNDAPSFTRGVDQTVNATVGIQTVTNWAAAVSAGPTNEATQTLSFQVSNSNNALFTAQPTIDPSGTLTYTPAPTANGTATVTVRLQDSGGTINGGVDTSAPQTFTITVNGTGGVNQPPTFTPGSNQTVLEDAGAQTVNWATGISAGAPSESSQSLSFLVTTTNSSLFAAQPAIDSSGVLTYRPAPNANGAATLTVRLQDSGGTANGGIDTSAPQTFTIGVTAVNDAPSFTVGSNQTVSLAAGAQTVNNWATALSVGPTDEATQTLSFQVSNSDSALFSAQPTIAPSGSLTYTPIGAGTATVTVRLQDSGGTTNGGVDTSAPQTFTITVNTGTGGVNQAPTFTPGSNQTVLEDAGAQTVNWATAISAGAPSESGQSLSFTVTASNSSLFTAQPSIDSSGVLTYTPAPNANGTATLTVRLQDNGGTANGGVDTSAPQTFTIGVTAVNDAPSFTVGSNQTTLLSAGAQTVNNWATAIAAGPTDEATQTLSFQVSNSNNTLFSAQPTVDPSGRLTYTPAAAGTATVTVRLQDSGGTANGGVDTSAPQTFTITTNAANNPPAFTGTTPNLYRVVPNTARTVTASDGLLRGVTDLDGQPLQVVTVTAPIATTNGGTVTLNADGSFVYTPPSTLTLGTDTFTYRATDGIDPSSPITATLSIGPNAAPIAVNDSYRAVPGSTRTVDNLNGVLSNDTDVENDPRSAIAGARTTANGGTVTLNADGSFTYTPASTFTLGTDTFTYQVTDGLATSTPGTVTINVAPNNPPVAVSDTYSAAPGGTRTVDALTGVVNNDSDVDVGDRVLAVPQTNLVTARGGTVNLSADGAFTYAPAAGVTTGTDTFTYQATDGIDTSTPATVTLSIVANNPPVASNDTIAQRAIAGQTLTVGATSGVLLNDSDGGDGPTRTAIAGARATANGGTVTLNADGSFVYTPRSGFTGPDTFTYQVSDGIDTSATATVSLSVVNNAPPVAVNDNYTAIINGTLIVPAPGRPSLLANDTDPDNNTLTVIPLAVTGPSSGNLSLQPNGSFTYTPNDGFQGVDTFTYRVNDGLVDSANVGTVSITVTTNVAPVANPDTYSVNRNNTLSVAVARSVLANDVDNETLTASIINSTTQGTLTLNGDGTFVYVPNPTATGTDTFVYRASDGSLNTNATATITINTTSQSPVATSNTYDLNANGTLNVTQSNNVLLNDTDIDGDLLKAVVGAITTTRGRTVTMNADGTFTYTPAAGFVGQDTFTYQVTDGINNTPGTVTLNVGATNNPPVVTVPGGQSLARDTTLTIANGLSISDPDAGNSPVIATLTATNGSLFLSTTTGLTVTNPDGDKTAVVQGTLANINAALTNLRYQPDLNYLGPDEIIISVNDQGNTGGSTPTPQTGTGTIAVNVTAGTSLVRDINQNISPTGTLGSNPSNLVAAGSTLYFAANDGAGGVELWRSDGTDAGTTQVADINTISGDSSPTGLTVIGNTPFFAANNGSNGVELWKTDLTTGVTTLVKDIRTGAIGSSPTNLVNLNGTLFFRANDGTGSAVWRSDGTDAGTTRLAGAYTQPANLTAGSTALYFTGGNGAQLWRTDGTTTTLISDLGGTANISNLTAIGDTLFFTATSATNGNELWRSDGTTVTRITDLNAGVGSSNPNNLVNLGGTLYFFASDGTSSRLYRSTAAGVVSPVGTALQSPSNLTVVGTSLFFVVDVGTTTSRQQIWKSDGSTTSLLLDINPTGNAAPASLTNLGGTLFFTANDGSGIKVWQSDGSSAGTRAVSEAFTIGAPPANLTAVGGKLYFAADTGTSGTELFSV